MFLWCVQEVAELKEEDLPSDTATATGDPCSTLSESQYTHDYTSCDSGTPLYIGLVRMNSSIALVFLISLIHPE